MMVVILTPVDGIIRWLPRGFSCSPPEGVSLDIENYCTLGSFFDHQ